MGHHLPSSLADAPMIGGAYEDPDHPGCKREVRVEGMKVTWRFNLTSGPGQPKNVDQFVQKIERWPS